MWSDRTKIAFGQKNISKEKFAETYLFFYMLNELLSKFEGKRTNSL